MQVPPHLATTEVVLRFLESVGRRSEAEFYLNLFRGAAKERFAVICVDGPVLDDALDAVALDLRFLASLDLAPAVVLGLFEPAAAVAHAWALAQRLDAVGVGPSVLHPGPQLAAEMAATARAGRVAIVPLSQGPERDAGGRFAALQDVVVQLACARLIFVQRRGGLRQDGKRLPWVNLTEDTDALLAAPGLSRKHRALLVGCRQLVCERAPQRLTAAIASPFDLLRELFTLKGAGTLLRRGARIRAHEGFVDVDRDRLAALLGSAFGRPPRRRFFDRSPWRTYVDDDYRVAAVVLHTELGAYLSKFAVEREAQGEGLGGDLWQRLVADSPTLFWRSRRSNAIDSWYTRQCDGLMRLPQWNVFWKGFGPASVAAAVDLALAQPEDFA